MYMYVNGELVREEDARISPLDHGFLYGLGVFETFRVYGGHPFLWNDHVDRLFASMDSLGIETVFTREELLTAVCSVLEKNRLTNAYIRMNVSAGEAEVGLRTEPYQKPNLLIFAKPLSAPVKPIEKKATFLSTRRNTPEGSIRLKSHHYLNNVLAKRELGSRPDMEGIFLTSDGCLAEGIVSNIFWVIDDELYTPCIETGILPGITRQFVMRVAEKLSIPVHEGFYQPSILEKASELFYTNSIQEMVPLISVYERMFSGAKGPVFQRLFYQYEALRSSLWSYQDLT